MKYTLSGHLLLILSILMYLACNHSGRHVYEKNRQGYHLKKNFDSLMRVTTNSMAGGLDFYGELLTDTAFLELFEQYYAYFDDVKRLLATDKVTNDELIVCIMSMQNLDADDYAQICSTFVDLYNRHKISESMLETCIMPNFLNKHIVAENYKNPAIVKFLKGILKSNRLSQYFRTSLEETLSGKIWRGIESSPEN